MAARLYGVPASHPTLSAELMLRRKGVEYRRLDLVPAGEERRITKHHVQEKSLVRLGGLPAAGGSIHEVHIYRL